MSRGTQEPLEVSLHFHVRGYHPLWQTFPYLSVNALIASFNLARVRSRRRPLAPARLLWSYNTGLSFRITRFGLFRFRSPLLSESRLFSLPLGTEMVHFPRFASLPYEFRQRYAVFTRRGFPHSEISGSQTVCVSPKLIVADHVLHRLSTPRHSHARP